MPNLHSKGRAAAKRAVVLRCGTVQLSREAKMPVAEPKIAGPPPRSGLQQDLVVLCTMSHLFGNTNVGPVRAWR
jgi:hypothetical protein